MFTLTVFEILMSECMSVLSPDQRGTGSERVNVVNNLFLYFETLGAIFSKKHFPEIASEKNRANGNVIYEWDWVKLRLQNTSKQLSSFALTMEKHRFTCIFIIYKEVLILFHVTFLLASVLLNYCVNTGHWVCCFLVKHDWAFLTESDMKDEI